MSLASKSQEQPLPVDGASPGELIDRGNALRKEGKHQQALEYFEQAAWLSPRDGNAWRCKADSLAMCFRYEASLQSCEKALEINPSDAEAWFLKSFALEMLGKYEEALESNAKSLEIDPGNKIAWVNKGQYLYALGRLEEAMESFGAALKIDPGSKYAKDVEDKVRAWMQREGGSDETIKQVIGFLQRGRCQEALKSYGDALKVDPREKEQSFSKDYALAHLKSPEKMLEEFQKQQEEIQPRFEMELSQKEFQFGAAAWAEVTLSNMGSAVATDIVLSFPPEVRVKHLEVDAQVLAGKESRTTVDMECIPELQPQKKKTRLISLTPVKAGHFPLDVRIAYTDALGNRRQKTSALWLNVFKRAEQLPKLPGYAIVWRMSSGEYADVFAAKRQAKDGATVVVKTLRLPAEQASLAMQFLREVRLWGKLSHPNIVRLFEWGDKPFPWMAMEYMEKGTLRKKLNSLSMMESLQIATRLAEALSYAKGAGVTHRDIKPENVLFDHDNNPKLSDWRLAGILPKSSEDGPKSGRVSAYSPPERLSTDFGAADWRTDIYQLGVLLYEMVTGKPPFTGDDEAVIEKIKKQQPRRPSEVKAGVGKHVDPIILKCLAKNRDERYQDALALKEELEKLARIYRV